MNRPSQTASLKEVKEFLREHAPAGVACPACRQLVKFYLRRLNGTMCAALILIARHFRENPADEWIHVPTLLASKRIGKTAVVRGGDWAKLVMWSLIEPKPREDRGDGSTRSGYYRITPLGEKFARGEVRVPWRAKVYNQQCLELDESNSVDILEALGSKFNYGELMEGA